MANTTKPTLKYRVVSGRNPHTGEVINRPVIAERETYYLDQVVEQALSRGYIRGQFEDMKGAINGALECVKKLGEEGKAVNLDWFRVHAEITGTVGDSRQLTGENQLHVAITALQDLKASIDDFSWQRVDEGAIIKIENVSSPGGNKGEIIKSKAIVANGNNLAYNRDWSDSITFYWDNASGEACELQVEPSEQSEAYLRFDWEEAFGTIPVGADVKMVFKLHGSANGAEQTTTKTVKLVEA